MLAPNNAGTDSKNEILLASYLSNFKNLPAVIAIPALLTPGINANTWKKPINNISLMFKFLSNFFSTLFLSAIYNKIPNIKVAQGIT